ncbi:MAG: polyprenyl synthetase family protein, partial [Planifilum fulgidum]
MEPIEKYLEAQADKVHRFLEREVESWTEIPPPLREAMAYSLLAGGKRLRPILVLATAEALGGSADKALPFAGAVEMIHTYSLIHDDLPAMDDDDFRRGKPTNHKVFGEAMAILAGDALLTKAFGLLARAAREAELPAETALALIEEGSRRFGAEGMVGGQVLDIQSENRRLSLSELEAIHRGKTGDLIIYSVRLGALISGSTKDQLELLTSFAGLLGLAFQIQDDILDVIGDQETIGKPVGSDQAKNKATYPSLIGLEQSRELLRRTVEEAKELLSRPCGMDT